MFNKLSSQPIKMCYYIVTIIFGLSINANAYDYTIEQSINDEYFIINGETFETKSYCSGWDEGDTVVFIEGSSVGACVSALLYNKDNNETCDVWCE